MMVQSAVRLQGYPSMWPGSAAVRYWPRVNRALHIHTCHIHTSHTHITHTYNILHPHTAGVEVSILSMQCSAMQSLSVQSCSAIKVTMGAYGAQHGGTICTPRSDQTGGAQTVVSGLGSFRNSCFESTCAQYVQWGCVQPYTYPWNLGPRSLYGPGCVFRIDPKP